MNNVKVAFLVFVLAVAANYEFVRDTIVTWNPLPSP